MCVHFCIHFCFWNCVKNKHVVFPSFWHQPCTVQRETNNLTQTCISRHIFVSSIFNFSPDMTILGHLAQQRKIDLQRDRACWYYGKIHIFAMAMSDSFFEYKTNIQNHRIVIGLKIQRAISPDLLAWVLWIWYLSLFRKYSHHINKEECITLKDKQHLQQHITCYMNKYY